jgi:hypothetical protein
MSKLLEEIDELEKKWEERINKKADKREAMEEKRKNDPETLRKREEIKKRLPEGFDEAVKNALLINLDEWLMKKDTLSDNQQLNSWYKIWGEYKKIIRESKIKKEVK